MPQLKKYISPTDMKAIEAGKYHDSDKIPVYFNLGDFYTRSIEHVLEIAKFIMREYPHTSISDMEIFQIPASVSKRNAQKTTVYMKLPAKQIADDLADFNEL